MASILFGERRGIRERRLSGEGLAGVPGYWSSLRYASKGELANLLHICGSMEIVSAPRQFYFNQVNSFNFHVSNWCLSCVVRVSLP